MVKYAHNVYGSIFFYGDVKNEDENDDVKTTEFHEFDFHGQLIHRYLKEKIPKKSTVSFENIGNSTYVTIFNPRKRLEHNGIQILKLEKGKIINIIHIGESETYVDTPNQSCDVDCLMKKFGQWLFPQIIEERQKPYCFSFTLTSLQTKEKLLDIFDLRLGVISSYIYFINWNMNEIARTFWDDDDNFIFKLSHRAISGNKTLKHLARIAVLTSFNEEYLMNLLVDLMVLVNLVVELIILVNLIKSTSRFAITINFTRRFTRTIYFNSRFFRT